MSLQKQIKTDMVTAMRNKDEDAKNLLRVIMGDIDTISKAKGRTSPIVSDQEIIGLMKKLKENAVEMKNQIEIDILDGYLPTLLGEKQLETLIKGIISKNGYGQKDMGKVMGFLKSNYGGTYDGRMASVIVKNNLV